MCKGSCFWKPFGSQFVKCKFKFEKWLFAASYLTIVLSCYYLSNELTVEIDVLNFHQGAVYMWAKMKQQSGQNDKGNQKNTDISW